MWDGALDNPWTMHQLYDYTQSLARVWLQRNEFGDEGLSTRMVFRCLEARVQKITPFLSDFFW